MTQIDNYFFFANLIKGKMRLIEALHVERQTERSFIGLKHILPYVFRTSPSSPLCRIVQSLVFIIIIITY